MSLSWYEHVILQKYNCHGLLPPEYTLEAAVLCIAQIRLGWWQVFDYPRERVVAIVGGPGEVHIWADGGNLLRFGLLFMRDVWAHTTYLTLTGIFMDPRMERYATRLGWKYSHTGELGQRYWSISRKSS